LKAKNWITPWITSSALNELYVYKAEEYVTENAIKKTNLKLFPKNSLLIALYGEGKTRGKCSELMFESTTNQAIATIILNPDFTVYKDLIKMFLLKNYEEIRFLSSGGVQPNLNLSLIKNMQIPLPPLSEQHQIVFEIERRLTASSEIENQISASLQKAELLKQSILKQAFSGKLIN